MESWSIEFGTRRVTVEEPLSGKRRLTERAAREENGEKVANAATIWVYRGITKYDLSPLLTFLPGRSRNRGSGGGREFSYSTLDFARKSFASVANFNELFEQQSGREKGEQG